ncbi:MAG: glycosyltransferase family 4 protein, partial [Alphaproteobacteria bacterium]
MPTVLVHGLLVVLLFACSAALTKVMIRVGIADVPNDRSSHARPVPTSGGLAVAATFTAGIVALYLVSDIAAFAGARFMPFLLLAGVVAAFALYDDVKHLPVKGKLSVQLVCALAFSIFVANVDIVTLPGAGAVALGPWGHVVTVLWIVAFMNAFNFMDGINGIAGGSALIASVFLGAIAYVSGAGFIYLSSLCLAGATLGFLVFNFPRGRIFLGDTGSQFIAFVLAGLAVMGSASETDKISIFVVPMIFFPFLYDVFVTLVYRLYNGRNVFSAHREHHYQ